MSKGFITCIFAKKLVRLKRVRLNIIIKDDVLTKPEEHHILQLWTLINFHQEKMNEKVVLILVGFLIAIFQDTL